MDFMAETRGDARRRRAEEHKKTATKGYRSFCRPGSSPV